MLWLWLDDSCMQIDTDTTLIQATLAVAGEVEQPVNADIVRVCNNVR